MPVSDDMQPMLIAMDWGTTNRRGYLIGSDGAVMDSRADGLGLTNVEVGGFQAAFDAMVSSWTDAYGALPALLSGMVGASTGWREAPYCNLPVGLDELATELVRAPGDRPVWIVPGVSGRGVADMPDVIRGEEIQAIAAAGSDPNALIVLPGTHSKWVQMEAGRIVGFKTFMTGDLHAAILNHTVVSVLAAAETAGAGDSFEQGVTNGRARHGELTHILFGARSRVLFGELAAEDVSDYLSGLLIGAEIAAALDSVGTVAKSVLVAGNDTLAALYRCALAHCGVDARVADGEAIGETYWQVAKRAGLLEDR